MPRFSATLPILKLRGAGHTCHTFRVFTDCRDVDRLLSSVLHCISGSTSSTSGFLHLQSGKSWRGQRVKIVDTRRSGRHGWAAPAAAKRISSGRARQGSGAGSTGEWVQGDNGSKACDVKKPKAA
eukprot:g62769.t1